MLSALAIKAYPTDVLCGPWISDVTETSFTVNWVTEGATLSWVEAGIDDGKTITVKAYDTAGKLTKSYNL